MNTATHEPGVYYVRVGDQALRVDVQLQDDHAVLEIAGQRYEISGQVHFGEALQRLTVNGAPVDFKLQPHNGRLQLTRGGLVVHTRALTALEHELYALIPERAPPETGHLVPSPMTGKVIAVLVKPGDAVKAGHTLCIIEAMKMENTLQAPRDGVLAAVHAQAGAAVEIDQLLMEFERPEDKP
jgi:propionyl-CoA carboxylase alpha chain